MAVPKLSSQKQGQAQRRTVIYVGFRVFWIVMGGVAILAVHSFLELWRLSSDHQNLQPQPKQAGNQRLSTTNSNANAAPITSSRAAALMKEAETTTAKMTTNATTTTITTSNKGKNPNEVFVVGVMFSDSEKYIDALKAEFDTWMSEIPSERVFAVGPAAAVANKEGFPRVVQSPCTDRVLWCKRLQQIPEAYKLLQSGIHFDWLLSGNEDWYVNLPAMRGAFAEKDPNDPVVYSNMGCNFAWEYNPSSKNGTLPKPPEYNVDTEKQCEEIGKRGGICAGSGIVFSRGAVETMMQAGGGEDGIFNITRSLLFEWKEFPQDDPVLSCLIYALEDSDIRMELRPWEDFDVRQMLKEKEKSAKDFASAHAVTFDGITPADIIRRAHDRVKKDLRE